MKVKFGGKFFQTKLLSARLLHKVCRLLSSPVLLRKFTNTVTLKYSAYFAFYTRSVFYIYPVRNPQPAVPIFMPPDLKRFTLRSILQQGYNKSLITSEKTFSLFLGKRLSHDTCRLWIAVGVTFPLETARRRHETLLHYKATAILFAVTPLPVLLCHFLLYFPPHIRQNASRSRICCSMTLDRKEITELSVTHLKDAVFTSFNNGV